MYTEMVPEKVCRQRPRGRSQGKRPATAWPRQTAYHTIVQPTYTRGPRAALALAGSDKADCVSFPGLDFAGLAALRVQYLAHLPCETASGVISPWLPGSLSGASGILPRLPGMPMRLPTAPEDWHLPDSHRITRTPVRA